MAISSPFSMSKPSSPRDAGDLLQLLQARGFGDLHPALTELTARYGGWLADYELDPTLDPDYRPLGELISVLLGLPESACGDELALSLALLQGDFLFRGAIDRNGGRAWQPLAQSYRAFCAAAGDPQPMWEVQASCTAAELAEWLRRHRS